MLLIYISFILMTLFIAVYNRRQKEETKLPDLPWVNRNQDEWFSILRASIRTTRNFKQSLLDAYENYSAKNQSFILPTLSQNYIVLPPSTINWLINQPENVLNVDIVREVQLQVKYTFTNPKIVEFPTHHDIIKAELTRQISNLTSEVLDELVHAFNDIWGENYDQWEEVAIFKTVMRIVARASNRVLVGTPLCRDKFYLDQGANFAQAVPLTATIINQFPSSMWPLVGRISTIRNNQYRNAFAKRLRPEIERRQDLQPKRNDFLQWLLDRAEKAVPEPHKPQESHIDVISDRLLAVNFAAIHTTTFSITNVIFDLVSSDPAYIDELRKEVTKTLETDNGVFTKNGLAKMHKLDSALRESSRLNSFVGQGLNRQVVVPEGVTTPNGTHCPFGSIVSIPTHGIHHDGKIYPDATEFKPFRFSEMRAEKEDVNGNNEKSDYIKRANLGFVTTSVDYQSFGHGRHACPGRFFAAHELKLMLAYMILHYDFEMMKKRPEGQWIGPTLVPPLYATVNLRRRKGDEHFTNIANQ